MKFAIIALCLLFISGCAQTTSSGLIVERGAHVNLTAKQIASVKSNVAKKLVNPQNAKFGPIRAARDKDGVLSACGTVEGQAKDNVYKGKIFFGGVFVTNGVPDVNNFGYTYLATDAKKANALKDICRQGGTPI